METKKKSWFYNKVLSKFEKLFYLTKKAIYFAWYRHHFLIPPRVLIKYARSYFVALKRGGGASNLFTNQSAYHQYLASLPAIDTSKTFDYQPLISFIVPTYNVSKKDLSACLDSLLQQSYKNYEICIVDDHSSNQETLETLKDYEQKFDCIHVEYRNENGMISVASNQAIKMAKGEFIALVDNDDLVEKDALYLAVEMLNKNPRYDFIYTDEDKIDFKGEFMEPHFKPDYSPDTLMGLNYICHLSVIRTSLVNEIGGFRKEFDGSQDYDLFLRLVEKTDQIGHVERICYHWRQTPQSTSSYLGTKNYAYEAAKRALEESLQRRNTPGEVINNPRSSSFIVNYANKNQKVSIIIPIKDQAEVTRRCLESLYQVNRYQNFEIILIDNRSSEQATFDLLNEYQTKYDNFKVLPLDCEFNYSYINNEGVKHACGEYLLFLNNDTEITDPTMIEKMLGYASLDHMGCVGVKLLYPDHLVQHAGVVLGFGGVAGHIYVTNKEQDNGLFSRLVMPYNYSAVTAACLMVSADKFKQVQGFDETLKVALNDVDLNLKMLKAGYYNVCLSHLTAIHYETKTRGYEASKEKHQRFLQEQAYMKEKWGTTLDRDPYFSSNNF